MYLLCASGNSVGVNGDSNILSNHCQNGIQALRDGSFHGLSHLAANGSSITAQEVPDSGKFAPVSYSLLNADLYLVLFYPLSDKLILSKYVAGLNRLQVFRPHSPLSTAYKTCVKGVLYATDKGLQGQNICNQLLTILLHICS